MKTLTPRRAVAFLVILAVITLIIGLATVSPVIIGSAGGVAASAMILAGALRRDGENAP